MKESKYAMLINGDIESRLLAKALLLEECEGNIKKFKDIAEREGLDINNAYKEWNKIGISSKDSSFFSPCIWIDTNDFTNE